jgi:hypothetical protein
MKGNLKGIIVLLGGLFFLLSALPAVGQTKDADSVLGEKLVRAIFSDPEAANLSKGFQSVHLDGARDYNAEKKRLTKIDIRNYTLSDFRVTREANVLVVTYTFTGQLTLDGRQGAAEPSPRMSVFIKKGKSWLWLAHANLVNWGRKK